VPSVTQLVVDDCAFWTEEARARGKAIHRFSQRVDLGERVDLYDLPVSWRGYGRALFDCYETLRPRWTEVEVARINEDLGYGGRRDRVGVVFACVCVVDLKTGDPDTWHAAQLAGYDLLDRFVTRVKRRRFAFYLAESGAFKVREYHDGQAEFLRRLSDYKRTGRRVTVESTEEL